MTAVSLDVMFHKDITKKCKDTSYGGKKSQTLSQLIITFSQDRLRLRDMALS